MSASINTKELTSSYKGFQLGNADVEFTERIPTLFFEENSSSRQWKVCCFDYYNDFKETMQWDVFGAKSSINSTEYGNGTSKQVLHVLEIVLIMYY